MLYAYGATIVEVVRRKEFCAFFFALLLPVEEVLICISTARFFYQRSQSILEIMAKLSYASKVLLQKLLLNSLDAGPAKRSVVKFTVEKSGACFRSRFGAWTTLFLSSIFLPLVVWTQHIHLRGQTLTVSALIQLS